jgi:hypothetical protein
MIKEEEKLNLHRVFDAIKQMNEPITGISVPELYKKRKLAKEKYRALFSRPNLQKLSKDECLTFLYFENNQSWTGLYRRGTETAENMSKLKEAIVFLQNESTDIKTGIHKVLDDRLAVKGMGKNLATAIWGWNNKLEETRTIRSFAQNCPQTLANYAGLMTF